MFGETSVNIEYPDIVDRVFQMVDQELGGPHTLYLFGSFARGQVRTSSDIDVAVDCGQPISHACLVQIRDRLEESCIPFRVDVVDLQQTDETTRRHIAKEAIRWIG